MAQNPRWLPIMAINYSYKSCSFCIINYFETSSTALDIPKKTQFLILVWVFMKNINVNKNIIMETMKKLGYRQK